MAQLTPATKSKIMSELAKGDDLPKVIAKRHGVSTATVYTIKNRMLTDQTDGNIKKVTDAEVEVLEALVVGLEDAPKEFKATAMKIIDGAKSLKKLELGFHSTFYKVLRVANDKLDDPNIKLSDWHLITTTLASAFDKIYSGGNNTFNIAQGDINTQTNKLSMMQGKMRP